MAGHSFGELAALTAAGAWTFEEAVRATSARCAAIDGCERAGGLMRNRLMIDGRNVYDGDDLRAHGFTYQGVGRGTPNRREASAAVSLEHG